MKVKPISPGEIICPIPDFVIEAFNTLIQRNWNGVEAKVFQAEVMDIITSDSPTDFRPSRQTVFDNHWLDVEDIYRKAGWKVTYFKTSYFETYNPYFLFRK